MTELPLLLFTVLTGLSAGGFVMSTVFGFVSKNGRRSWLFSLVCLVLLGLGMICVLFHLGRPERFMNAFANPTAGITLEAYCSIAFGILLLIDAALLKAGKAKGMILPIVASICGAALLAVTAYAYFTSYGVAPWMSPSTFFQFILGDLALGSVFSLAFNASLRARENTVIAVVLIALFIIAALSEAAVFSQFPVQLGAFIVCAIIGAGAGIAELRQLRKGVNSDDAKTTSSDAAAAISTTSTYETIIFALMLLAVIAARFGFYSIA